MASGGSLSLTLDHLIIKNPGGKALTLTVYDGDYYTLAGSTITPDPDFLGVIAVPVSVSDGDESSETISLLVVVREE